MGQQRGTAVLKQDHRHIDLLFLLIPDIPTSRKTIDYFIKFEIYRRIYICVYEIYVCIYIYILTTRKRMQTIHYLQCDLS